MLFLKTNFHREMKSYVQDFKEKIDKQEDQTEIFKSFENICSILNAGCQFLNFPVQI